MKKMIQYSVATMAAGALYFAYPAVTSPENNIIDKPVHRNVDNSSVAETAQLPLNNGVAILVIAGFVLGTAVISHKAKKHTPAKQ